MQSSNNVALFWDGGVESTLALQKILQENKYNIKTLFSIISEKTNEISFTGIPEVLVKMQSQQLKIPILRIFLEDQQAQDFKLSNISKYITLFKKSNINTIILPFLEEIESNNTDIQLIYPNIDCSPKQLYKDFIERGNKAVITAVNELITPLSNLGKDLNISSLNIDLDIKTFTIYTTSFKARLIFSKNITVNQGPYTVYKLREV